MECPSTPAANVLIEDDVVPLDQSIKVLISFDRYLLRYPLLDPLEQARGGEQLFFGLRGQEEENEGWVCAQVLVGTPSSDFSEEENETQLIYSGSVLLDLHPLP